MLSGSFDTSAIRWSLEHNSAEQVLRFHEGAVNAVALLPDGRAVTAGEDARIAIWPRDGQRPEIVLAGHRGPIVALGISTDAATLASASWDHTIRLWPLGGGPSRVLAGHQQNVNAVAFMPDGNALVSAGYDATLRIWPLARPEESEVRALPSPLNALVIASDGEIGAGGADGKLYILAPDGGLRSVLDVSSSPILALAISADGSRIAATGAQGSIAIIDRSARRVERRLVGPALPLWAAAFKPDGRTLLVGAADRMIHFWDAQTGEAMDDPTLRGPEDPLAAYAGDPGAEAFRACAACHTLAADDGNRAGPSLHRVFGRRIASLPGYNYSEALRRLDIVWTPETLAKLLEVGPAAFTPGTKMPEQRMSAEQRDALVHFLERAAQ